MEYNLSKHSVGYCDRFLDTVNEQLVDFDLTLPDYCPDIEKILKCTLIPKIYTRSISGGQLTVDGVAVVRILYCDSVRHHVRSFEQSSPFSATFSLKTTPQQYIVVCDTKCEYINCRALSPRKLVIHGAFSLYAKVMCKETSVFYSFNEDCDLQTKLKEITVSDLSALCEEQFSVTEDITVSNKPPVESLLSYDVSVDITDLKSISNKLMLNAELTLKVMYLSDLDSGNIEHISYVFPINKIFDCDGVMEDVVNVPKLEIMSYDLHIRNDHLNDGSLLSLDVKLSFCDLAYTNKKISVIEDAYSTLYKTESKHFVTSVNSNHTCDSFIHIAKSSIKLDDISISKVLNIFSQGLRVNESVSESQLGLSCKANVCMLIEDTKSDVSYIERSIDVDFKPAIDHSFTKAELNSAKVHSISFRIVDENTVEIRLELKISVVLFDALSINPITYIKSLEEISREDDCALVLYFADKGESVWDISKMYGTKTELLMSENSLESPVIDTSQMLLVPTE